MRVLRAIPGALLWIVASLLGLVGIVLCITVILLPVGLPLVKLAGRLFKSSMQLMLPPGLAHPVKVTTKAAGKRRDEVGSAVSDVAGDALKNLKKGRKAARKQWKRVA